MEPNESFWNLLAHFLSDLTHFDGKFFTSLRYLILRPGFLPAAYKDGRRAAYLNPVRMYLFTSAFFFLIFTTLYSPGKVIPERKPLAFTVDKPLLDSLKDQALRKAGDYADSVAIDNGMAVMERVTQPLSAVNENEEDTFATGKSDRGRFKMPHYASVAAYDSVQQQLPPSQRDNWWLRPFMHKKITLEVKYGDDYAGMLRELLNKFVHLFPYLLFISLPLFAIFLKMLYIRHREFYLVNHIIFLGYLYIFTFIFLLFFFALNYLRQRTGWGIIGWVQFLYILYGVFYAYRSLRHFYGQGSRKTLWKFIFLNLLASVSLLFLFIVFLGISIFQI